MTPQEISELIAKLKSGDNVQLLYKKPSARAVAYLVGMHNAGVVVMDDLTFALAYAIGTSGEWDGDRNRTLRMKVGAKWDVEWFSSRVTHDIEKIELLTA